MIHRLVAVAVVAAALLAPDAGAAWVERRVTLTSGVAISVDRCQFQRRWYGVPGAGRRIDRVRTHRLRGDRRARRFGCGFDVLSY